MNRRRQSLAVPILLAVLHGWALAGSGNKTASPTSFTIANVHFEQNATDDDVEVVFQVKGGPEGLAKLKVVSPDGRTVVDFAAPDASTLGIRQFRFESPEPKDVQGLKSAYPEGVYTFSGTTASGNKLIGESRLNHILPTPASFLHPQAKAEAVAVKNLKIAWTPVKNLAAYIVYIEQDEMQVELTVRLPGTISEFSVPDGFLIPDTQYTLGLGTVTTEGNVSFIETWFTTAVKP